MTSAKFSVQVEQKSLCFKSQSGNTRLSRFLAFRFFLALALHSSAFAAGVFARGGGQ